MNTEQLKTKLLEEKALLETELSGVGHVNPDNPADWESKPADLNIGDADKNERADRIEEFETTSAIEVTLENRLNDVTKALKRMEDGKYGICEISGEKIEEDRLLANPAARTCKAHINEKVD